MNRKFSLTENNKGLQCPYRYILCQEGWCSDCNIYQTFLTIQEGYGMLNKKGEASATIRGNKKGTQNKQSW